MMTVFPYSSSLAKISARKSPTLSSVPIRSRSEKIEVLFLGEPFREIGGFVLPNGSEIVDFFEFSEEA